jgi:hypothetical protein
MFRIAIPQRPSGALGAVALAPAVVQREDQLFRAIGWFFSVAQRCRVILHVVDGFKQSDGCVAIESVTLVTDLEQPEITAGFCAREVTASYHQDSTALGLPGGR